MRGAESRALLRQSSVVSDRWAVERRAWGAGIRGNTQMSGVPHRAGQHAEMAESPALCSLGFPRTKFSARCPTLLPALLQLNTTPPGRVE